MAEQPNLTTATDLLQAIELAERSFDQAGASTGEYRLIRAQQLLAGGEYCSSPRCWQLTFKLARLFPTAQSPRIGAGGELFFTVDVERGEAKLTGRGE